MMMVGRENKDSTVPSSSSPPCCGDCGFKVKGNNIESNPNNSNSNCPLSGGSLIRPQSSLELLSQTAAWKQEESDIEQQQLQDKSANTSFGGDIIAEDDEDEDYEYSYGIQQPPAKRPKTIANVIHKKTDLSAEAFVSAASDHHPAAVATALAGSVQDEGKKLSSSTSMDLSGDRSTTPTSNIVAASSYLPPPLSFDSSYNSTGSNVFYGYFGGTGLNDDSLLGIGTSPPPPLSSNNRDTLTRNNSNVILYRSMSSNGFPAELYLSNAPTVSSCAQSVPNETTLETTTTTITTTTTRTTKLAPTSTVTVPSTSLGAPVNSECRATTSAVTIEPNQTYPSSPNVPPHTTKTADAPHVVSRTSLQSLTSLPVFDDSPAFVHPRPSHLIHRTTQGVVETTQEKKQQTEEKGLPSGISVQQLSKESLPSENSTFVTISHQNNINDGMLQLHSGGGVAAGGVCVGPGDVPNPVTSATPGYILGHGSQQQPQLPFWQQVQPQIGSISDASGSALYAPTALMQTGLRESSLGSTAVIGPPMASSHTSGAALVATPSLTLSSGTDITTISTCPASSKSKIPTGVTNSDYINCENNLALVAAATAGRENLILRQRLSEMHATVLSLQMQVQRLQHENNQLRQLPTGKISQIPIEDMIEIMQEYGSEVSETAMPPRKSCIQKASIVRQFRRWNPNFLQFFEHINGKWSPKLGKIGELARREQSRQEAKKAAATNSTSSPCKKTKKQTKKFGSSVSDGKSDDDDDNSNNANSTDDDEEIVILEKKET